MDKGKLSTSANLLRLSTLGIKFVLYTFSGVGLGWLAKRYLHWGDWVIMVGLFFGIVASYTNLLEDLKAFREGPPKQPNP